MRPEQINVWRSKTAGKATVNEAPARTARIVVNCMFAVGWLVDCLVWMGLLDDESAG